MLHPTHKFTFQGTHLRLSTAFAGGGLARVEETAPNVFDCWPYMAEEYRDGFLSLRSLENPGPADPVSREPAPIPTRWDLGGLFCWSAP